METKKDQNIVSKNINSKDYILGITIVAVFVSQVILILQSSGFLDY